MKSALQMESININIIQSDVVVNCFFPPFCFVIVKNDVKCLCCSVGSQVRLKERKREESSMRRRGSAVEGHANACERYPHAASI